MQWCVGDWHRVGRAARHYNHASRILVAGCMFAPLSGAPAPLAATPAPPSMPHRGAWHTATAPARVDLAGGWSDTPPITFEAGASAARTEMEPEGASGGLVVNAAVTVDGCRPIGCRVRVTDTPVVTIRQRVDPPSDGPRDVGGAAAVAADDCVTLRTLEDFSDHATPGPVGTIVKCALLCLRYVVLGRRNCVPRTIAVLGWDDAEPPTLAAQLARLCGGGLEVETWSTLPQGSGMGTSSILAGAVLAALCSAVGHTTDASRLVDLVLQVEQVMSTGGRRLLMPARVHGLCHADVVMLVSGGMMSPCAVQAAGKIRLVGSSQESSWQRAQPGCPCLSPRQPWSLPHSWASTYCWCTPA